MNTFILLKTLDGLLLLYKMAKNAEENLKESSKDDKLKGRALWCHLIEMTGKVGFAQVLPKRQSLQ